jgi:hypothetical protein
MASNFYRPQDSPKFILGHSLELGFAVVGTIAALILRLKYETINKQRDKMLEEMRTNPGQISPQEMSAMGDRSPAFRYAL